MQDVSKLSVAELKERLRRLGLALKGKKADLLARLLEASANPAAQLDASGGDTSDRETAAIAHMASPLSTDSKGSGEVTEAVVAAAGSAGKAVQAATKAAGPKPGTTQLDGVATAQVAISGAPMI